MSIIQEFYEYQKYEQANGASKRPIDEEEFKETKKTAAKKPKKSKDVDNPSNQPEKHKRLSNYLPNPTARSNCFTKRKLSLMNKVAELHCLTGASVMLVITNENGTTYSMGCGALEKTALREELQEMVRNDFNANTKKGKQITPET